MLAKIFSAAILGVDAYLVHVEVDIAHGLPSMMVVGLPDTAVQESKERVRSAIKNTGYTLPAQRITINMAPADTRKSGPVFDLAIAIGILAASAQILPVAVDDCVIAGELSLDGTVRGVQGVLPFAIAAQQAGKTKMIVPQANAQEAALVEGLQVYPVQSLQEALQVLSAGGEHQPFAFADITVVPRSDLVDYADVKGQIYAKRGLEVAAAGNHNLIMIGSPGSGKTMLARRIPTILPPMTFQEALETSKIYSIAGRLGANQGLIQHRPFRSPHHSISSSGLVGGTSMPKPGEVSLAHHGVLFLDELLEFRREVLEVLRQPLEDRMVTISRAQMALSYPCDFLLVASMNGCLCGFRGDIAKPCVCTPAQVARYWNKLSGPLLDRMDIHLEIRRLNETELLQNKLAESSAVIRERVIRARNIQLRRFAGSGLVANAQMQPRQLRVFCKLDQTGQMLLQQAIHTLNLSARAYDRILKVARTIADLAGSEHIEAMHVAEAIQFRTLDRQSIAA